MTASRLTILGGTSPFAAALFDALAHAGDRIAPRELTLFGRNAENLDLLGDHARRRLQRLGWTVRVTADLPDALQGAGIVLHQIRYGGMEGRLRDEEIASSAGVACDETLGPAALHRALCSAPELERVADSIVQHCPRAWVVNLTNPLSIATTIMHDRGVARCVGVCELPAKTVRLAASALGLAAEEIDWRYEGLNHRGFIVHFQHRGVDLMPDLASRLGPDSLSGVTGDDIAALGAIPTKYFTLLSGRHPVAPGRAAALIALQWSIRAELRADRAAPPPSMKRRNTDWYPEAVIPLIAALSSTTPSLQVVNVRMEDGLVRERLAFASRDAIVPQRRPAVSGRVRRWLHIYERHEKAMLEAVRRPCRSHVRETLDRDPLVPAARSDSLADAIWGSYRRVSAKSTVTE